MKTMDKFANWFMDHDKRIMEAHNKGEKRNLDKEMSHMQEERHKMQDHLHRLEVLIEKHEELQASIARTSKGGV